MMMRKAFAVVLLAANLSLAGELAEVAPGVYFRTGDLTKGQSNGGYVVFDDFVLAVEAPNAKCVADMFDEANSISSKPLKYMALSHGHWDHASGVDAMTARGVEVICSQTLAVQYRDKKKAGTFIGVSDSHHIANGKREIRFLTFGRCHSPGDMIIYLPAEGVVFTGDMAVSIPKCWMGDCDLENWITGLRRVEALAPRVVCPGHGPYGDANLLVDQRQYLTDLRDQVGYQVCQGRTLEATLAELAVPHKVNAARDYRVEVPNRAKYVDANKPFADNVKAAYAWTTTQPAVVPGGRPQALVLLGDHYHPPDYMRPPLEKALAEANLQATFLYDPARLDANALQNVQLLVVLRDGMVWPDANAKARSQWWMTDLQEQALVNFVQSGGGLLAVHNATALRPGVKDANDLMPFHRLMGCSYNGHGSAEEKFSVHVVHKDHPVLAGVEDFEAVDERHTPIIYATDLDVLLEAVHGDKKSVDAYVRSVGKGRICYLALGHTADELNLPAMQKLMANAMKWLTAASDTPRP